MDSNDLLQQLGIYFRPQFLSAEECRELVELLDANEAEPAGVYDDEGKRVDLEKRRVSEVSGVVKKLDWVSDRLDALREEMSAHFSMPLESREGPAFLRYEPGDFFLPHRDSDEFSETSDRKITMVVYLNEEGPESKGAGYEGACLTLYGLLALPGTKNHGFPIRAETGLLVAFPSDTRHGVSELTKGRRYCAVCWYR